MLADIGLLERFPLIESNTVPDMQAQLEGYLCPHRLRTLDTAPSRLRANGVEFAGVRLLALHYDAPVEVSLEDTGGHYLFRTTLQGQCEIMHGRDRRAVGAGGLSVCSPFSSSRIVTGGSCRNVVLKLDRQMLELQLQQLLGRSVRQPLAFDVPLDAAHPGAHALSYMLDYVCRLFGLDMTSGPLHRGLSDHLVQLLLTQLPHNYSADLQQDGGGVVPGHVRRARDYIEEHLDEPLTLAALCELTGVSVRTLQNGFSHFLGQTPVEYIRERRLAGVHRALRTADESDSVTQIFLQYGVNSPGHFSRQYRQRFGCRPSETLKGALH